VILRVAAKHGATQVRLIGSVARGEARPDSDVDLLVTWQEGTSLLDQAALKLELESLLGRKVDIASDGWVNLRYANRFTATQSLYEERSRPAERYSGSHRQDQRAGHGSPGRQMTQKDLPKLEEPARNIRATAADPRLNE